MKDYEVGYRKPPKAHQFKPGQSGNPKGRRKKVYAEFRNLVAGMLDEKVPISTPKGRKMVPLREAIVRRWVYEALKGGKSLQQLLSVTDNLSLRFDPGMIYTRMSVADLDRACAMFEEWADERNKMQPLGQTMSPGEGMP